MLIEESCRRQKALKDCLYQMASNCMEDSEIRKVAISFKALYSSNFRHYYSEFFPIIVDIAKDGSGYSLEYLSNNIESLRALVETDYVNGEKEFKGLYMPLSKLSDHINLEIARYAYYSSNEQKVKDLERKNQDLQDQIVKSTKELTDAKGKIESVQTELIGVLSIFAAIVLTFSGGLSLLGGAFSSIASASFYKIIITCICCGFVLCNTIFMLMYLISKIMSRNIYARCKKADCTCGQDGAPSCCGIKRIRKRLPYVFWINVFFVLLSILTMVIWLLDKRLCLF